MPFLERILATEHDAEIGYNVDVHSKNPEKNRTKIKVSWSFFQQPKTVEKSTSTYYVKNEFFVLSNH